MCGCRGEQRGGAHTRDAALVTHSVSLQNGGPAAKLLTNYPKNRDGRSVWLWLMAGCECGCTHCQFTMELFPLYRYVCRPMLP